MDTSGYVVKGPGPSGYGLDGYKAVQRGRQTEVLRTLGVLLVLLVVQLPMRKVAQGDWDSERPLPIVVPGRLSLMVDVAMIFSYLLLAYRSFGLLRSMRPDMRLLRVNQVGVGVVFAGAAMDLYEDIRLWDLLGGRAPAKDSLSLSWSDALGVDISSFTFSDAMHVVVLVGLGMILVTTLLGFKGARGRYTAPVDPGSYQTGHDVICCSGGGIRSASFSLGGLEALAEAGIYAHARSVVGVSGGGYMGAAYHVARWDPADVAGDPSEWPNRNSAAEPYGLASPETGWVRRHTRYVLGSVKVALQAVLSLGFGIAVNLLLLTSLLGALAWILGWLYLASGRLPGNGAYAPAWTVVADVWWLPAAGVLVFVARKVVDRWWTMPAGVRNACDRATALLIVGGGAATVLVLGVPWLLHALDAFADDNSSAWADLVRALGLVTTKSQVVASSPAKVSGVTIGTIVSAILAVLASVKSAGKESASAESALGKVWGKIWTKIKDPVVPWLAVAAVVLVLAVVLLHWIAALVAAPALLQNWKLAYIFGSLLLLAKLSTDANRTSLHHFFRERISGAFLVRNERADVKPIPYHRPLRFSGSEPLDGGPELIACAVANVSDEEIVPSKRGCVPFVFDREAIGLTDRLLPRGAGQRDSATYEFASDPWYRDATMPAALAMSAAAFSPLAGRENVRLGPYRAVLALANARLGVWLPNPLWVDEVGLFKRLRRLGRSVEAAEVLVRIDRAARQKAEDEGEKYVRPRHPKLSDAEWHAFNELASESEYVMGLRNDVAASARRADELRTHLRSAPRPSAQDQAQLEGLESEAREARNALQNAQQALLASEDSFDYGGTPGWGFVEGVRTVFKKPGLSRLAREAVGKASIYDRFLYVTDGGHYDNLGLIEALRRRPSRIFILDASNDKEDSFRTLGRAIATARMDLDCDVRINPRVMKRVGGEPATAAWCVGDYEFAGSRERGQIFLCKAIMLGDLSWDIQTYADDNSDFPRTSTNNQLYSEFDFESYRALGRSVVSKLLASPEYARANSAGGC